MSKTSYSSNAFKNINLNFAIAESGNCFIADSDHPAPEIAELNTDRQQLTQ